MNELSRSKLAIKYIFFELVPAFFFGMVVFLFVLIMFQSFKLSEYIIVHGANTEAVLRILFYMSLGFLPILIPIALLFSVLLVYGRLSGDSEVVAFKSLGLNSYHLLIPSLLLGTLGTLFSLQVAFQVAPWGQRNLDTLLNRLTQMQPGVTIREGVFSKGFFNLVVYANKIDSADGKLKQVFIYDERNSKSPMTIIAREGQIIRSADPTGLRAFLRLKDGNVHRSSEENYTKIDFINYDINLFNPHVIRERRAAANAMSIAELKSEIKKMTGDKKRQLNLALEYNRRWSLALAGFIFALIGFSLGTVTNKRTARSGSMVICISAVVVYWIIFVAIETAAQSQKISPSTTSWATNSIFLLFGLWQFSRIARK